MKTIKATLFTLAAFLISGIAGATGNLSTNISSKANGNALIEISNAKETIFEIDVRDENGEIIFSKKTVEPATDYNRMYDFSKLADGNYFFTVEIENEKIKKSLEIENGLVKLIDKQKMVSPHFSFSNDMLKLSFLNFEGADMKLYVYQGYDQLLSAEIEPSFAVHKAITFSELENGIYDVVFASGETQYEFKVFKK